VRDGNESNPYRNSPVGPIDITDIGYVPYGGVYEREGVFEVTRGVSGGAYEIYVEPVPVAFEAVFASPAYPPLFEDSMAIDSLLLGGTLITATVEDMALDAVLLSGTLSSLLLEYEVPAEDMDLDAVLLSGTLDTVLLTYTMLAEDMDLDATLLSGTLDTVLITYSNWPAEDLDLDATLSGGTLA
jgi:hypothetical protein